MSPASDNDTATGPSEEARAAALDLLRQAKSCENLANQAMKRNQTAMANALMRKAEIARDQAKRSMQLRG